MSSKVPLERYVKTDRIKVEGMSCEHCVVRVKDALAGLEGVQVESLQIGEVVVLLHSDEVGKEAVLAAIQSVGYTAT